MKKLTPFICTLCVCLCFIKQNSISQNITDCNGALDTLELQRNGALFGITDFPVNGNEKYTWYDAATNGVVAEFINNPYFSPANNSAYYVIVTDPDFPDCFQVMGPRIVSSLDGCCELNGEPPIIEYILGCTNAASCNYNANATVEDDSCFFGIHRLS